MELLNQEIHFALRTFLLLTAFIMGAADGAVIEQQCYWCGPVAEEVHNSRRAPPCNTDRPLEVTLCTRDQPYCAVVVTAPPYTESRVCTRFYQDECYARYCNTTKIWKMVCSCRGALCNGAVTDREYEAFSSITNLVANTHNVRTRRDSLSSRISARLREDHTSIQTRMSENEVLKPIDDITNSSEMLGAPKSVVLSVPLSTSVSRVNILEPIPSTAAGKHSTHNQVTNSGIPMQSNSNGPIITPLTMTVDFPQNHQTAAEMGATKETYKDMNIKIPMLYPYEQPPVIPITVILHPEDIPMNDEAAVEIGSINSTYSSKDKISPMSTIPTNMITKHEQRQNPTKSTRNKAVISTSQITIVLKIAIVFGYFLFLY